MALREGDAVAFRRSSGKLEYGRVSHVHADGHVTVVFCGQTLYKTLPADEVSTSALPFVAQAKTARARRARSTGRKRKKERRTGKKR